MLTVCFSDKPDITNNPVEVLNVESRISTGTVSVKCYTPWSENKNIRQYYFYEVEIYLNGSIFQTIKNPGKMMDQEYTLVEFMVSFPNPEHKYKFEGRIFVWREIKAEDFKNKKKGERISSDVFTFIQSELTVFKNHIS